MSDEDLRPATLNGWTRDARGKWFCRWHSTGPDHEDTITTHTSLSSSQALTALWALRHYRAHVESNLCAEWPSERRADVLRGIEETIATITKGRP